MRWMSVVRSLPGVRGHFHRRGIRRRLDAVQDLRSMGLTLFPTEHATPPPELLAAADRKTHGAGSAASPARDSD